MDEWDVLSFGLSIAGRDPSEKWNAAAKLLSFRSLYGIEPDTAIDILNDIQNMNNDHRIQHPKVIMFFVTLHWLRVYDVGSNILFTFGIGSKVTVRKYIRIYLKALQALCREKIVWPFQRNTIRQPDEGMFCGSIDGTHCLIEEPRKFPDSKWYSHKFHGPGLTYQIVLSLHESKVLSIIGPYPAGNSDLTVYRMRDGIKHMIPHGSRLIGDRGYVGEPETISTPNDHDTLRAAQFKGRARSRHETFNGRLKDFNILDQAYRHTGRQAIVLDDYEDHKQIFESVCILVQYDLQYLPLFAA